MQFNLFTEFGALFIVELFEIIFWSINVLALICFSSSKPDKQDTYNNFKKLKKNTYWYIYLYLLFR